MHVTLLAVQQCWIQLVQSTHTHTVVPLLHIYLEGLLLHRLSLHPCTHKGQMAVSKPYFTSLSTALLASMSTVLPASLGLGCFWVQAAVMTFNMVDFSCLPPPPPSPPQLDGSFTASFSVSCAALRGGILLASEPTRYLFHCCRP